jgi:hypothetical protein
MKKSTGLFQSDGPLLWDFVMPGVSNFVKQQKRLLFQHFGCTDGHTLLCLFANTKRSNAHKADS